MTTANPTGRHAAIDDDGLRHCTDLCIDCHRSCLQNVPHCLAKGGAHAQPAHVRLMLDCADICQTSADFMIRESDLHAFTCAACAEVCHRCAEDCLRLGDDPHMAACAEVCRRCAQACREMAANRPAQA
jgi:hypothetical protein